MPSSRGDTINVGSSDTSLPIAQNLEMGLKNPKMAENSTASVFTAGSGGIERVSAKRFRTTGKAMKKQMWLTKIIKKKR